MDQSKEPKDYSQWHVVKSGLQENTIRLFFHEREMWFTSLGANVGFEQDGRGGKFLRPVVIVRKFNKEMLWVIPTTKKNRAGSFYHRFSYGESKFTTAILSQMRLIDSKRLLYRTGVVPCPDFIEMKKRLISFLK